MMHGREKSDPAIVAGKPTNKAGQPAAEPVERRAGAKGNADQQSTRRAQDRESVSQALDRIRQAARQRKKEKFTALFHHLSIDHAADGVLCAQARSRTGRGWADMAGLRGRPRSQDRGLARHGSNGEHIGRSRHAGGIYRSRMAASARLRSPRSRSNCTPSHPPLGSAEVIHPFHPLRGQRFVVLKVRRVSGVETLSLRHADLGSFAHAAGMDRLGAPWRRRLGWRRALADRRLRSGRARRTHRFADTCDFGVDR